MKQYISSVFLAFSLLTLSLSPVKAESIQEEYSRLTERRVGLENRAATLKNDLKTLEIKTRKLEETWLICANGRWRLVWDSAVTTANGNREALEAQRRKLFALNKSLKSKNFKLEQKRRKIDHDFQDKGFEYDTAFREFMHMLENEYLSILEDEYFHGFERYLSGVKSYQAFVEYAIQACQNSDVTPVALEQGLIYTKEIIDIVNSIKNILKGV